MLIFGLPNWRGRLQTGFIDVANAGDFETGIGVKGGGVVHAALAHSNNDDFVGGS